MNRYTFHQIETCNMCGASIKEQKVHGKRLNSSQGSKPHKKTELQLLSYNV